MAPGPRFDTLRAHDGLTLRTAVWQPEASPPRGTILLLHGRTEFIEKYGEVADELTDRGFAVFTFDWRGQGRSDRMLRNHEKGHVETFDDYVRDLTAFIDQVVHPHAPRPIVMLAHSMGGNIALRYLHDHPAAVDRVVLSAPMVDIAVSPLARIAIKVLATVVVAVGGRRAFAPRMGAYADMPFDDNPLTHDAARLERMNRLVREDPALAVGGPTYGWLRAALASSERLLGSGFAQAINTPILLMSAAEDEVVSNKAQAAMAQALPSVTLVTLENSRHEPLMETDPVRAAFYARFDAFVP